MTMNSCSSILNCLYIILILQHYLLIRFNSEYSKIWEENRKKLVITEYDVLILGLITVDYFRGNPFNNFIANLVCILFFLFAFLCFVAMQCLVFYLIALRKRIDDYNRKI